MNRRGTVTLRLARTAEAGALAGMSRDLIEAGLGWRYTPARMASLISHPETLSLVACDGVRIQGFATMQFGDDDAHLVLLCVSASQRRRGIGRQLHEWLVASARVAGLRSIQLELRADNDAALSFYRWLGYTATQWLPAYYGGVIAARRMQLALRTE